jgi:cytochrome c oxidase cbb3-type subunit 3
MSDIHRTDALQGDIIHVYDDIEEADNRLPNWWLATFYGAIAFGCAYWFVYHTFALGKLPVEAYGEAQMAALDKGGPVDDQMLIELSTDNLMVAAGDKLFHKHCVSCHKATAGGDIGPNLTDEYWLHGGAPSEIYHTVTYGVDGKGMQAWGPALGSGRVKQVVAYVLTLRNTHVAGGKPPQGEKWIAPAAPAPTSPDAGAAPAGAAPAGGTPADGSPATGAEPASPSPASDGA